MLSSAFAFGAAELVGDLAESVDEGGQAEGAGGFAQVVLGRGGDLGLCAVEVEVVKDGVDVDEHEDQVAGVSGVEADAIIVDGPPTTRSTNRQANGISDNYALGILTEAVGLRIPSRCCPSSTARSPHTAFQRTVALLREIGFDVIYGPGRLEPHPPGTGGSRFDTFPWHQAPVEADTLRRSAGRRQDSSKTLRADCRIEPYLDQGGAAAQAPRAGACARPLPWKARPARRRPLSRVDQLGSPGTQPGAAWSLSSLGDPLSRSRPPRPSRPAGVAA